MPATAASPCCPPVPGCIPSGYKAGGPRCRFIGLGSDVEIDRGLIGCRTIGDQVVKLNWPSVRCIDRQTSVGTQRQHCAIAERHTGTSATEIGNRPAAERVDDAGNGSRAADARCVVGTWINDRRDALNDTEGIGIGHHAGRQQVGCGNVVPLNVKFSVP